MGCGVPSTTGVSLVEDVVGADVKVANGVIVPEGVEFRARAVCAAETVWAMIVCSFAAVGVFFLPKGRLHAARRMIAHKKIDVIRNSFSMALS